MTEITAKSSELKREINLKMQQHVDLVNRHQSYNYSDDGGTPRHDEESGLMQQQVMLDRDELKI